MTRHYGPVPHVLDLELSTLYVRTPDGRLERERRASTGFYAPPFVAVACGVDGLVWACSAALPGPTVAEVDAILRDEPVPQHLPDVGWSPDAAARLIMVLPAPDERTIGTGPSYVAPLDRRPAQAAPEGIERRTSADTDLAELGALLPERDATLDPPWVVAIVDGEAAAVCETARSAPDSVEAGVWTSERFRRRGLATAVTDAWLGLVASSERTAFYSTSDDNLGSQGVARRLGLTPIGQWWQVR
jgi:hypothetical protein